MSKTNKTNKTSAVSEDYTLKGIIKTRLNRKNLLLELKEYQYQEIDICECGYTRFHHISEFQDGTWGEQLCPECWKEWKETKTRMNRKKILLKYI